MPYGAVTLVVLKHGTNPLTFLPLEGGYLLNLAGLQLLQQQSTEEVMAACLPQLEHLPWRPESPCSNRHP